MDLATPLHGIVDEIGRGSAIDAFATVPLVIMTAAACAGIALWGAMHLGGRVAEGMTDAILRPRKGGVALGAAMTGVVIGWQMIAWTLANVENATAAGVWTSPGGAFGECMQIIAHCTAGFAIAVLATNALDTKRDVPGTQAPSAPRATADGAATG